MPYWHAIRRVKRVRIKVGFGSCDWKIGYVIEKEGQTQWIFRLFNQKIVVSTYVFF